MWSVITGVTTGGQVLSTRDPATGERKSASVVTTEPRIGLMINPWIGVGAMFSYTFLRSDFQPDFNSHGYGAWIRFYPLTKWQAKIQNIPDIEARRKDPDTRHQKPYKYRFVADRIFPFVEIHYLRLNYSPFVNIYHPTPKVDNTQIRIKMEIDFRIWKSLFLDVGFQTVIFPTGNDFHLIPIVPNLGIDFIINPKTKK